MNGRRPLCVLDVEGVVVLEDPVVPVVRHTVTAYGRWRRDVLVPEVAPVPVTVGVALALLLGLLLLHPASVAAARAIVAATATIRVLISPPARKRPLCRRRRHADPDPAVSLLSLPRTHTAPPTISETMSRWVSSDGTSSPTLRPRRSTIARSATSIT